jgi:hypothetical protein
MHHDHRPLLTYRREPTENQRTVVAEYDQRIDDILKLFRQTKTIPVNDYNTTANAPLAEDYTVNLSSDHTNDNSPLPASTTPCHRTYKVEKAIRVRQTCEGCRKLKIRCVPSTDGGSCEKCHKRGTACVSLPRAGYRTRRARMKI